MAASARRVARQLSLTCWPACIPTSSRKYHHSYLIMPCLNCGKWTKGSATCCPLGVKNCWGHHINNNLHIFTRKYIQWKRSQNFNPSTNKPYNGGNWGLTPTPINIYVCTGLGCDVLVIRWRRVRAWHCFEWVCRESSCRSARRSLSRSSCRWVSCHSSCR